jgi:hypothetical protein
VNRSAGCLLRPAGERGDSVTRRLFGSIVSYRARFGFLGYTNDT